MNVKTNKYEYIEQNGCHNCNLVGFTIEKCSLDGVKIKPWGICKKWEETKLCSVCGEDIGITEDRCQTESGDIMHQKCWDSKDKS